MASDTLTEDPDIKPFDVAMIKDTIAGLGAFVWANTPQGHHYWEHVERSLELVLKIAKEQEKSGG